MKKPQHIPGPWKFDAVTAKVWTQDGETDLALTLRLSDEGDASGRLMAAAPDLLAALETIATGNTDPARMVEIAREAIAKTEGAQ